MAGFAVLAPLGLLALSAAVAIVTTNTPMRTSGNNQRPTSEAARLLASSTASVAIPRPSALPSVVLTASSGQSPSSWTSPGFWRPSPLRNVATASIG